MNLRIARKIINRVTKTSRTHRCVDTARRRLYRGKEYKRQLFYTEVITKSQSKNYPEYYWQHPIWKEALRVL